MPPRIAIPMPHSIDLDYAERSILQYERAVQQAGGEPVRIPLGQPQSEMLKIEITKIMESCDGVLLPGSKADVDPSRFNATRSPHTAIADARRDTVDDLLLQDAYNLRKPILGICYGLQSLNVYRSGSLIQHIPDFLPEELRTRVNHEAGKTVAVAHAVEIESDSKLAGILRGILGENENDRLRGDSRPRPSGGGAQLMLPVNSSHHQSADLIGDGLCIAARCPDDGIIEALEGTSADHFVLAVQWHPERSVDDDPASRAIFQALVRAAETACK